MREAFHWYDGVFYDLFIAPNQDRLFAVIRRVVAPGDRVLDVGCGTGRLVFQLAPRVALAHGIDPSRRNIQRAKRNWERRGKPGNVLFMHGTLSESPAAKSYDVAVLSFVLHEIDSGDRAPLLSRVAGHARRVVLADFRVPRVPGVVNAGSEIVEFLAGREHYRGFRSFVRAGGLTALVTNTGLRIVRKVEGVPLPAEVMVVEKAD